MWHYESLNQHWFSWLKSKADQLTSVCHKTNIEYLQILLCTDATTHYHSRRLAPKRPSRILVQQNQETLVPNSAVYIPPLVPHIHSCPKTWSGLIKFGIRPSNRTSPYTLFTSAVTSGQRKPALFFWHVSGQLAEKSRAVVAERSTNERMPSEEWCYEHLQLLERYIAALWNDKYATLLWLYLISEYVKWLDKSYLSGYQFQKCKSLC